MTDRIITGSKVIARILGCSPDTVLRLARRGDLPGCFQIGGRTSPLKVERKKLERIRRGRKTDDEDESGE
jgi:hypothetical protein